jgi:NADH-quinone oxidoreductase subunit C
MSDEAQGDEATAEAPALSSQEVAYGAPVSWSRGQRVIHPERDQWQATALELLADGWDMCLDVTAVDYLAHHLPRDLPEGVSPERFEVVATFVSYQRRERLRARIQVPDQDPTVDSLYAVYPGSDFLEREVYDLFGIVFNDHPDLSRILMPETWEGHPLRKDFAIGAIPVQFKAASANPDR